jgi:hypothetical protein
MIKPKIERSFVWTKTSDGGFTATEVEPHQDPELTDSQKSDSIGFWNTLCEISCAPCIGCGYCCAKAPCEIASRYDCWSLETGCEALKWDGTRHRCLFYLDNPEVIGDILAIGWGCSSSLFNSYREEIRDLTGTRLK